MELCSMLCGRLDGRRVWRRMVTCICMAESFCCPPETIITLFIGYMKVTVAQSCLTLCNPVDYTVQGILQARILEWVAVPFSRVSNPGYRFLTQGSNPGLLHCRWILYQLSHQGSPGTLKWVAYSFSGRSSWPGDRTRSPALQVDSLSAELPQ